VPYSDNNCGPPFTTTLEREHMDVYDSFDDLKKTERERVDFRVDVFRRKNASTVVLAPHGGGIEPGTSEIARAIAGNELSLGIFEGTKPTGNARLHITSTNFDEPRCLELVQTAKNVLTIHGEDSTEEVVFLGGKGSQLAACLRRVLQKHGYKVEAHDNPDLQGMASANICNRGVGGAGVQLELSVGLRRTFFESLKREGRRNRTAEFTKFAEAVREGLRDGGAL
jgi:phage replication-related protein YjqB (UPF0714/DUF867 family)